MASFSIKGVLLQLKSLSGFYKTLLSWIIDGAIRLPVPYIDSFSEEEEECMPYVMSSSSQDDFEKLSNWTHRSVSRPIVYLMSRFTYLYCSE